jgi:hypothetical protein
MTRNEYNRYSMFRKVTTLMIEHESLVQTIPALKKALTELSNSISVIEKKDVGYQSASKGTMEHKHSVQDELAEQMGILCGSLYVFGQDTGNDAMCEMTDIAESALKKMRETELLQKGKSIVELLTPNRADLVAYGVKEYMVEEFSSKIAAFGAAVDNKDTKHIEAVATRSELSAEFIATDLILKNKIDKLMGHMRVIDSNFYNKYQQARVVKDLGVRHQNDDKTKPGGGSADVNVK